MLTVIGTGAGEWQWLAFSREPAAAFAYLALVGSVVGYVAYIFTLKHLPVSTISLYSYINPVIAVVLGASSWRRAVSACVAGRRRTVVPVWGCVWFGARPRRDEPPAVSVLGRHGDGTGVITGFLEQ